MVYSPLTKIPISKSLYENQTLESSESYMPKFTVIGKIINAQMYDKYDVIETVFDQNIETPEK